MTFLLRTKHKVWIFQIYFLTSKCCGIWIMVIHFWITKFEIFEFVCPLQFFGCGSWWSIFKSILFLLELAAGMKLHSVHWLQFWERKRLMWTCGFQRMILCEIFVTCNRAAVISIMPTLDGFIMFLLIPSNRCFLINLPKTPNFWKIAVVLHRRWRG